MGLFSRKKQRDHQPGPSTIATSSGARASQPSSSSARDDHASPTSSTYSSLPHQHDSRHGGPASPPLPSPPERNRVFGALGSRATSSTLSLPAFGLDARPGEPRRRQVSAMGAVNESEAREERDKGKWSRWKLGRGSKQRRDSVSSSYGTGGAAGGEADDGSSFVVKSFRTVSRVHEDPIPSRPSYSSSRPPQPTLPHLPTSAPPFDAHDSAQQQESLRSSLDYGSSSRSYPRRPSLATIGAPNPSTGAWDPAPSPTITAEAFRLASARSKSSVSLASLANGLDDPSSPVEAARPRFEPQRPASRTSRRGSSYSEAGVQGILVPPRPSFAMGQQPNGSSSSVHSRASSNASLQLGANGLPSPADGFERSAGNARPTGALRPSESTFSVASFTTAPEGRSGTSTPRPLSQVGANLSDPSFAVPRRPGPAKRMSTDDSELRLIASYGDMISSSPPLGAPIELPASFHSTAAPFPTTRRASFETPQKGDATRTTRTSTLYNAPSVAVQPPTPQSASGFSPVPKKSAQGFVRPKRTSSLAPEGVQSALRDMGEGGAKGKGKGKGWVSDSSDDEGASSESDSDEDDEIPLATIRSRSQTDLTLRSSMDGGSRPVLDQQQGLRHQPSGELEVLKDVTSPVKSSFGPDARRAALGVSPLQRRGSNRRSVSTLSLSTSMTVSQAAAADAVVASTPAPASPTRSAMRPPFQPRSVSNPSTPTIPPLSALSSSAASSATATPVPSPLFATSARDRSSASSGSGTASSSSVPHTPKDNSPNVSDLNFSTTTSSAHAPKPSVKFDLGSTENEARWNKGRRMSTQSALGGGSFLHPPSSLGAPFAHRSNPSLPTFAGFGKPAVASVRGAPNHARTASAHAPTPASRQPASNASTSGIGSSASSTAVEETVYDRMKARHKAEAIEALKIGHDLNHPSGLVPDRERDDDDEDENEPLANLPTKGSVLGGQSTMSGMSGMFMHPMGMGMGGTYSPLAVAPPGVDPYLYASLPPDQKMSLHQRASQMMAMMQEAAVRAKAESVVGGAMGGSGSSDFGGSGGSMRGGHMSGMSLGSYDAFYGGMGGMYGQPQPQHPFQQQHHHMPSQSMHLPPFAPSFAMSQPFFQPQAHPGFYGMPAYAGSAMGLPSGPASTMGMPGAQRPSAAGKANSAIGTGQRRR